MARFLIALVVKRNSDLPLAPEIFKVSENCSHNDVTVPLNTVFFMFAHANTENATELVESFVTLKLGNILSYTISAQMTIDDNGKRYWVGTLVPHVDGSQAVLNKNIGALIPAFCLKENDEVVDL